MAKKRKGELVVYLVVKLHKLTGASRWYLSFKTRKASGKLHPACTLTLYYTNSHKIVKYAESIIKPRNLENSWWKSFFESIVTSWRPVILYYATLRYVYVWRQRGHNNVYSTLAVFGLPLFWAMPFTRVSYLLIGRCNITLIGASVPSPVIGSQSQTISVLDLSQNHRITEQPP